MNKIYSLSCLLLFIMQSALGQWTTSAPLNNQPVVTGGKVGIGTHTPRGKFDIDGGGDIFLSDEPNGGASQSIYLPGHIYLSPHSNSNISYIQARRFDNSGTTSLRFRTFSNGALTDAMHIEGNGNVGIGTTSSSIKLDVVGLGGANTDLRVNGRIHTGDASNAGGMWMGGSMFVGQTNSTSMGFYNNGAWRIVADNNGNVGIGTKTPNKTLTVNGTIYGKEVEIDLNVPGPDYVFEKDYNLPALEEIKKYIDEHKHLPEVPSAKEMEANGINVGEMNMILLKKVEELTLYLIEQKKVNDEQNLILNTMLEKIKAQQIQIESLRTK